MKLSRSLLVLALLSSAAIAADNEEGGNGGASKGTKRSAEVAGVTHDSPSGFFNKKGRLEAVDPWLNEKVLREDVPGGAKFISHTATLIAGTYLTFWTLKTLWQNTAGDWVDVAGVSVPYPTLGTVGVYTTATAAIPTVDKWGLMVVSWVGKQVGKVVDGGWRYVKYGWDNLMYLEKHIRAQYFQGTLFQVNRGVKYLSEEELKKEKEKEAEALLKEKEAKDKKQQ